MESTSDGALDDGIVFSSMRQPPLIKQLKGILSEYPDGGQILKELIQNAEDADANEVRIMYDGRRINDETSETPQIYNKFFRAPALCVYNDAVFTERDWDGIRMIYSSVKEDDPLKVGRFGLGFKSVFHITDYPCVLSGDKVLLIDPQQSADKVNAMIKLSRIEHLNNEGLNADAFWRAFDGSFGFSRDCVQNGRFQGTVMWFPLRTTPSNIADTLYDEEKVLALFDGFQSEASCILLFLKNLEKISVCSRSNIDQVKEIVLVKIEDSDGKVKQNRTKFKKKIKALTLDYKEEDVSNDLQMTIQTTSNGNHATVDWQVVNYFVGNSATTDFQKLIQDKCLGYCPHVAVATQLRRHSSEFEGHVFCFLPLPREGSRLSGLPVHVHGCFALSQNRHHLKWETDEQHGKKIDDKSILWNKFLIKEALPRAYSRLVQTVIEKSNNLGNTPDSVAVVYRCVPLSTDTQRKWTVLENEFYKRLKKIRFIYCKHKDKWITLGDASFATFERLPQDHIHVQDAVIRCLNKLGKSHVEVPTNILRTLQKHFSVVKDLSPEILAKQLHQNPAYRDMPTSDKLHVLTYLVADRRYYEKVEGLELLPLASGGWTSYKTKREPIYICSAEEVKIITGLEHMFVMTVSSLGKPLSEHINQMCENGLFQIQKLTTTVLGSLLETTIKNNLEPNLRITRSSKLTFRWLQDVWNFVIQGRLTKHFQNVHIVPYLKTGTWQEPETAELGTLSDIILVKSSNRDVIPGGVCRCFQSMGVKVVDCLPDWIPRDMVKSHFFWPSPKSIIALLSEMGSTELGREAISTFNQTCPWKDKDILASCLAKWYHILTNETISVTKSLEIFRAVSSVTDTGADTSVSATNCYIYNTVDFPEGIQFPFKCLLVDTSKGALLTQLGARRVSLEELVLATLNGFQQNLFQNADEIPKFMNYFIQNFHLFQSDQTIVSSASSIQFLRAGSRRRCKPSDLFDPSDSSLANLLHGDALLPETKKRLDSEKVHILKKLGLKGPEEIDADIILHVAKTLDVWSKDGNESNEVERKAEALMQILHSRQYLLDAECQNGKTLQTSLTNLSCVLVQRSRVSAYPDCLTWFSHTGLLCKPSEAKESCLCLLVGAIVPIVICTSDKMNTVFGWKCPPTLSLVIDQLRTVSECYSIQIRPDIMPATKAIYSHLADRQHEILINRQIFTNAKYMWTGEEFVASHKMIVTRNKGDMDLQPFFYTVPVEFAHMRKFFAACGCRLEQDIQVLINTLQQIREFHSTLQSEQEVARDRRIVCNVLDKIARNIQKHHVAFEEADILMMVHAKNPNALLLYPIAECTYDDDPACFYEDDGNVHLVHEMVSAGTVEALGVRSITTKALLDAEELGVEEWGQQEHLTTRIHALLREGYTDGLSVPKELIQNADDAGASTVKFLYDERENVDFKNRLLSKGLKSFQGPALWIFNDAQFSDDDMKNITKLNAGTKQTDVRKIGKFGLGFCSVYNLTDLPSFVSGSNIVFFDPHEKHLGNVFRSRGSGLKYQLPNKTLVSRYADQFKPYAGIFGCTIDKDQFTAYDGTLFRLPLRTEQQARDSRISSVSYTNDEMTTLLRMLIKSAGNFLLFSQNVKSVEIYHLSENATLASDQKLLYRIEKNSLRWDQGLLRQIDVNVLTRMPTVLQKNDSFFEIHKTVIRQTLKHDSRTIISGLGDVSDFAETTWITSWAKGTETSLAMYKQLSSQGAVPIAAVAVLCSEPDTLVPTALKNAPSGFYTDGHVFCFLPLPIKTKLPLHINGCFAVTSDRRQLASRTEDDKDSRGNVWNDALMEDALVKAHIGMLQTLTKLNLCTEYKYFDLWPFLCAQVAVPFKEAFYKHIIREDVKIFKGSRSWVSFHAVVFLDPKIRESTIGDLAFKVLMQFPPRHGKTLIEMPIDVLQNIKENNKERATQVRSTEINEIEFYLTFLRTLVEPFWNNRLEERNILIVAALKCRHVDIKKEMRKLRCIPTEPNNTLCTVSDLIHPHSPIASLFSVQEERFPLDTREFRKETKLSKLVDLGMNEAFLPSGLLIDRCESISIMADTCCSCARERCINLIKYLSRDKVLGDLEQHGDTVAAIYNQYMLPVLERPNQWQFPWQADTIIQQVKCFSDVLNCKQHRGLNVSLLLGKPKDMYRQNVTDYVGMVGLVLDEDHLVVLKEKRQNGEKLLDVIGIRGIEKLPVKVLVQQANILCAEYKERETQFDEVLRLHDKIFLRLEKELKSCESEHETAEMLRELRDCAFVLIGNELVYARNVAFNVQVQCKPYLYQLPEVDKLNKAAIYSYLGVDDYFSIGVIIEVMKRIQLTMSTAENVGIINHLLTNLDDAIQNGNTSYDEISELHDDIIAPDIYGALWPTYELVIENEEFQTSSSMKILHKSVAPSIGERLGVKVKKLRCYKDIKTGISFGQREELVTRIKGLLKAYPCDSSIMKELLQNADDAGATEIHFVKDYRNHSTEKLFKPECESLQGPSLCVYNNSYFTHKDIEGIHNLGQGSKGDDPTKTGQYGVGFNAVYHLTDTPSFVTMGPGTEEDGLLFIFDPLCNHVPEATLIEPGMMCKVQEIKSNFSDHLLGFSVDDLIVGGIGTVFRLPLRIKQSEISKEEIDIAKMDSILRSFESDMFEAVLFLKHIRCIKVSNITSGTLTEEYKVTVQLSDEAAMKRTTFNKEVCEITKMNMDIKEKNLETQPLEVIYPMKVVDNRNCSNHWVIVQRFGVHGDIDKLDAVKQSLKCGDLGMIPLGGVAIPLTDGLLKNSSETRGQNIPEHPEGKPNTLQDVHTSRQTTEPCSTNKSYAQFHGKAFCFLPLPVETGLPVHINGHFALDHEARRDLWKDGYRMDWNDCIACAVIIPSWISGLHYLRECLTPCVEKAKVWLTVNTVLKEFHTFFPVNSCSSDFWSNIACQFYKYMVNENSAIFPFVVDSNCEFVAKLKGTRDRFRIQWTTVNATPDEGYNGVYNTVFSELPPIHPVKHRDDTARLIVNLLKAFGLKLLETPMLIKTAMEKAGVKGIQTSTPSLVIAFMKTYIDHWDWSCEVDNEISMSTYLTTNNLNALVNYIVLDSDHHRKMEGLPVLLTADGIIRVCSVESPVFISKYSNLLLDSSNLFVHDDIRLALSDRRLFETNIFKEFKFEDFVDLLSTAMDIEVLAGGSKIMLSEVEDAVPQGITKKWLCLLYDLLSEQSMSTSNDAGSTIEDIHITDNINTDALRKQIEALDKWSFLPCVDVDQQPVLIPLRETSHLLFLSYFHTTLDDVGKALKKFQLPALYKKAFDECRWKKAVTSSMEKIVASLERPYDLLQCLVHHRDTIRSCEAKTGDDGTEILAFFGRNLKVLQKFHDETTGTLAQQLRQLPLYLTQQGTLTDIAGDEEVLVLPKGMPFNGIQTWADTCNITLLQEKESLESVYECMGLTKANVEYVYGVKILPTFDAMPNKCWMEHIRYLRDLLGHSVLYNDKQRMLFKGLEDIAFININGEMKRANELYDSQNEIFKVMVDSSAFPPSDLLATEWTVFLEKLGLICDVDDAMMVQFARQVEHDGNIHIDKGVRKKSRVLLSRFTQFGTKWSRLTLSQIRTLNFIDPFNVEADNTAICPQFGSANRLISFYEAISSTHSHLCWTSLNLLPSEICSQVSADVRKQLGIHEHPPLDEVISHFHNVCSSLKAKLKTDSVSTQLVKDQMVCFYEFFRSCTSSVQQLVSGFESQPFIHLPDEKDIVMANEVVIDLATDSEIKPYMCKAPAYYGKYYELFQLMGSRQKPMFCHYATILQSIKETSQEQEMSVPERGIVKQAFRGLVELKLDTDESIGEVQSIQLPNKQMVLKNSKHIVVSNKWQFERRLKGLIEIDLCAGDKFLDIKHCSLEDVFAKWPDNLRPVLLTDVVTEEVCIEISAHTVLHNAKARKIEKFLHSRDLVHGLCRLLKHQCTEGAAKVEFDSACCESEITKRLQNTNVVEMPTLRTTLKYRGTSVAGSERNIKYHIRKDDNLTGPFTFYFNDDSTTDSIHVHSIFHGLISLVEICAPELNASSIVHVTLLIHALETPRQISEILDNLYIPKYGSPRESQVDYFPKPGTYVEPQFIPFLEQGIHPFKDYEYDYVAMELEDAFMETNDDAEESPVYIYVKIVREVNNVAARDTNTGDLGRVYVVDTGNRPIKCVHVPIYRLYRFIRQDVDMSNAIEVYVQHGERAEQGIPFDDQCKIIRDELKEAWQLPEKDRKSVIRRILLKWHPDKNMGNEAYCTEVFKYIQIILSRLENGEELVDDAKEEMSKGTSQFPKSSSDFYENVFRRARSYARAYHENFDAYNRSERTGEYSHGSATVTKHPDYREAQRWLRQAKQDIQAADAMLPSAETVHAYNWICYLCHQACEKALKATHYYRDANSIPAVVELTSLAITPELLEQARLLEDRLGEHTRLRYPDTMSRPRIPSDIFSREDADFSLTITRRIIDLVADYI